MPDRTRFAYAAVQQNSTLLRFGSWRKRPTLTLDTLMTSVILALVPLTFAAGSLIWLMTSGAQAQARSDVWAAQWVRDNVA